MTKEQLIHSMSLSNFIENVHFSIGSSYNSIEMLIDVTKPLEEELNYTLSNERATIASANLQASQTALNSLVSPSKAQLAAAISAVNAAQESLNEATQENEEALAKQFAAQNARMTAERLSDTDVRLSALSDITSLVGIYISQNSADSDKEDSFNIAGFSNAKMLESSFGWNFKNIPKPTIDDLELIASQLP